MPSIEVTRITSAQESSIYTQFEQDDDLWMVLFTQFIRSRSESDEDTTQDMITRKPEWLAEVERIKKEGFEDVKEMCSLHPLQWNTRIKRLLSSPNQAVLLRLNLRSLAGLRTRKSSPADANGNVLKQIHQIVSALANETASLLDPYFEMTRCLDRNMTPGGKDLTDVSRTYYQAKQTDYFNQISTYLGMIILIKGAGSRKDIDKCQVVIRRNLIRPLEVKIERLSGADKKEAFSKLDTLYKMLWSIDVQFV